MGKKSSFTFQDVLSNELGPYVSLRDTAIDDVGFNKQAAFQAQSKIKTNGKPLFVANFPRCHGQDWFAQIKILKMRENSEPDHDEVKWSWFSCTRKRMSRCIVNRVYSGMGEAAIFVNDLHPFIQRYQHTFIELGIEKEVIISHPKIRNLCLQYASKEMIFCTPLFEVHHFDPFPINSGYDTVKREADKNFQPIVYLEKIRGGKALPHKMFYNL